MNEKSFTQSQLEDKQNKTKDEKGGQWWSTLFSSFVLLVTLRTKARGHYSIIRSERRKSFV